jgi:hypothetical protein
MLLAVIVGALAAALCLGYAVYEWIEEGLI